MLRARACSRSRSRSSWSRAGSSCARSPRPAVEPIGPPPPAAARAIAEQVVSDRSQPGEPAAAEQPLARHGAAGLDLERCAAARRGAAVDRPRHAADRVHGGAEVALGEHGPRARGDVAHDFVAHGRARAARGDLQESTSSRVRAHGSAWPSSTRTRAIASACSASLSRRHTAARRGSCASNCSPDLSFVSVSTSRPGSPPYPCRPTTTTATRCSISTSAWLTLHALGGLRLLNAHSSFSAKRPRDRARGRVEIRREALAHEPAPAHLLGFAGVVMRIEHRRGRGDRLFRLREQRRPEQRTEPRAALDVRARSCGTRSLRTTDRSAPCGRRALRCCACSPPTRAPARPSGRGGLRCTRGARSR